MKNKAVDKSKILQALDWSYEKALNGLPGLDSASELAESYLANNGELVSQANSLIRWQVSKTSTSGFLSGLGGLMTMPVAIPANLTSVIYVQLRMIAAIAHMGGQDIKTDQVKTLVYVCMAGNAAKDILKNVGIQFGTKLSKSMIQKYVTGAALTKINQAVGFRLATKFGSTGVVNLGKAVPLVGGVIGGSFDGITTNKIGNTARDLFIIPQTTTDQKNLIDDTADKNFIESTQDIKSLELQKFYSFINLIKIDGDVADEEMELLENLVNNSDLDDDEKMDIIGKISNTSMIDVDYKILKDKPEQSIKFICDLISLSKIDGQIHPTEKMFIKNVAGQIGIKEEDFLELLSE